MMSIIALSVPTAEDLGTGESDKQADSIIHEHQLQMSTQQRWLILPHFSHRLILHSPQLLFHFQTSTPSDIQTTSTHVSDDLVS